MRIIYFFAMILLCNIAIAQHTITTAPDSRYHIAPLSLEQLTHSIKHSGGTFPADWINGYIAKGDTLSIVKENIGYGAFVAFTSSTHRQDASIFTKNSYQLSFYKVKSNYYITIVDSNAQPVSSAHIISPGKGVKVYNENGLYVLTGKYNLKIIVSVNGELGYYSLIGAGEKAYNTFKSKTPKRQSMALLSQRLYRPGDTLRFSAIIFNKDKVSKRPIVLSIAPVRNYEKCLRKTISPNKQGIVTLDYVIPDSLEVDQQYLIRYVSKRINNAIYFRIEDYELDKTDVEVALLEPKNDSLVLAIKVQDNNGFTRLGSQVSVIARPEIRGIYGAQLYIPDTFWQSTQTIDKEGKLDIPVPDSLIDLFKGSIDFKIMIKTPTGEFFERSISKYFSDKQKLLVKKDSILTISLSGKQIEQNKAILTYWLGDKVHVDTIELPYKKRVNPHYRYTSVKTRGLSHFFRGPFLLQAGTSHTKNEISFYLNKPSNQTVSYQLYKNERLIETGTYTDTVKTVYAPRLSYWLRYHYMHEGSIKTEYITSKPMPNTINLNIKHPETTQPGKMVNFEFVATDIDGEPIKNAVVLGTSTNSQMPSVASYHLVNNNPNYSNYYYNNENTTSHSTSSGHIVNREINSSTIDLSDYHAIYYPIKKINATYIPIDSAKHSKLKMIPYGQLWVRITDKNQKSLAVYQVTIDGVLKYDVALGGNIPSILVSSGKHLVSIRTYNKTYVIKGVEIKANQKLLLSFNKDLIEESIAQHKSKRKIAKKEIDNLRYRIAYFQNITDQKVIVQTTGKFAVTLSPNISYTYNATESQGLLAPLSGGEKLEIILADGTRFVKNYEPRVMYIITKNEVLQTPMKVTMSKQKLGKYRMYTNELASYTPYSPINIEEKNKQEQISYSYDYQPKTDKHNLEVLSGNAGHYSAVIFQGKDSTFMLGNGFSFIIPSGLYNLYFVQQDSFAIFSNINIRPNGRTYLNLKGKKRTHASTEQKLLDRFDTEKIFIKSVAGKKGIVLKVMENKYTMYKNKKIVVMRGSKKYTTVTTDKLGNAFIPILEDAEFTLRFAGLHSEDVLVSHKQIVDITQITINLHHPGYQRTTKSPTIKNISLDLRYMNRERASHTLSAAYRFKDNEEEGFYMYSVVGNASISSKIASYNNSDDVYDYYEADKKVAIRSNAFPSKANASKPKETTRDNFSDLGFWMPGVVTDDNGRATFTTTMPDDIVTWKNLFIATDRKHRVAANITYLKSYKPVMAQVHSPLFLLQGDRTVAKGELVNTTQDSLVLDYYFTINGARQQNKKIRVGFNKFVEQQIIIDPYSQDKEYSLQFNTTDNQNYADGEKRKIPVYPTGMLQKTGGVFEIKAQSDQEISIDPKDSSYVILVNSPNELLLQKLKEVVAYEFNCNEQMASKLRALLILKKDARLSNSQNRTYDKQIRHYIKELDKNRTSEGSWGWWPGAYTNTWMTCYITEALYKARQAGYKVPTLLASYNHLSTKHNSLSHKNDKKLIINTLLNTNNKFSYDDFYHDYASSSRVEDVIFTSKLAYRLRLDSSFNRLDSISNSDILGNTYWGEDTLNFGSQHLKNTCEVLTLIKNHRPEVAESVRTYLWNTVYSSQSLNTYEKVWIAEALYESENTIEENKPCELSDGSGAKEVAYHRKTPMSGSTVKVNNPNRTKVYAVVVSENWVKNPVKKDSIVSITTSYPENIEAGSPILIKVLVSAEKSMGYVKIEVPIPAGCSYYGNRTVDGATHTEFYKNKVIIYKEQLNKGNHLFAINLLPKYSGTYTVNPANIELMYFPVINGNNELRKTTIR